MQSRLRSKRRKIEVGNTYKAIGHLSYTTKIHGRDQVIDERAALCQRPVTGYVVESVSGGKVRWMKKRGV
jgi:hypothetical protein